MKLKITIHEFIEALRVLDAKLHGYGKRISIKAIGGFALLWHSVRGTGYTADIDSVTADFPQDILDIIEQVASELDLPKDWVNNYNVIGNDVEAVEMMIDPFWQKIRLPFKAIDLWIADLETLIRAKLIAADDFEVNGRLQDFPDLVDLLKRVGCDSKRKAVSYCFNNLDIELAREYPAVYSKLDAVDWNVPPPAVSNPYAEAGMQTDLF